MIINNLHTQEQRPRLSLLLAFLACYILCAAIFQAMSHIPVSDDTAPLEYFTAGVLWMLSLISLLNADKYRHLGWRSAFWLAACAALAALAIDEIFAFHERTSAITGDDDYFKVVSWFAAGVVLYLICHMEKVSAQARNALVVGYLFHCLYILVEVGDGDYFRLPWASIELLHWLEEYFELFFLTSYLVAFISIYTHHRLALPETPSRSENGVNGVSLQAEDQAKKT